MSRCRIVLGAAFLCSAAFVGGLMAGDKPGEKKGEECNMPRATAGKEHKMLESGNGNWDAVVKCEGMPDSKGTESARTVCDGLWQIGEFKADFGGQPFEGYSIMGYDQQKKKYVSVWVDSTNSSLSIWEGTYDEKAGELVMWGEGCCDPSGKPTKMKHVSKVNGDTRTFKMIPVVGDGEAPAAMEITYTKKK